MRLLLALVLAGAFIVSSCGNAKKLQYMQGPFDPDSVGIVKYKEPVIQIGDILSITVFSDNPAASAVYNQPAVAIQGSGAAASSGGGTTGFMVDNKGNIQFHSIGNLSAAGLTRQELGSHVAEKLKLVLNNPYCQVRFVNFKITVIGEVAQPSVFSVPSEKISVLEAIGLAGDLTPYGRRDSVMIIRETATERKFGFIDLRKTDFFASDFFYLHQNDIIVVPPSKSRAASSDQVWVRNVTLAATMLSTFAVIYSLLIQ